MKRLSILCLALIAVLTAVSLMMMAQMLAVGIPTDTFSVTAMQNPLPHNQAWVGAVIGAATGAAQMLAGGLMANAANRKQKKINAAERMRALSDYNRDAYQDISRRKDMQYILDQGKDEMRNATRRAHAARVVAGGTTESEAVSKNAAAGAMAGAMGKMSQLSQSIRDNAEKSYQGRISNIVKNEQQAAAQQQAAAGSLVQSGIALAGNSAAAFGDYFSHKADAAGTTATNTTETTDPNKIKKQ